jgi:hypothetical protein
MQIELYNNIIKIIEDIYFIFISKFNIPFENIEYIYYDIYLIAIGSKTGSFIFNNLKMILFNTSVDFNNHNNIKYISKILSPLKTINNISFYIGALTENSKYKDTIYIYNTNIYPIIEKIIIKIEKYNKIKKQNPLIHTSISKLLI